jgi:hypothetical protein
VDDVSAVVWKEFREASFSVQDTLAALSKRGMNTPDNVDNAGVAAVAACASFFRRGALLATFRRWGATIGLDEKTCKRIVVSSSLGVTRRTGFPFVVLDAGGVLTAKAKGEAAA